MLDYLPALRERISNEMKRVKGEVVREPIIGELVIVREDGMPRGKWKVAKIENIISSEIDGLQRAAKLITISGKIITRPIRDVYPLEANPMEDTRNIVESNGKGMSNNDKLVEIIDSDPGPG